MFEFDRRTRSERDITPVDAPTFFGETLPHLIAVNADLAVPGLRELGFTSFTFEVGGHTATLSLSNRGLSVEPGDTGTGQATLTPDELTSMVHGVITPMTLLTTSCLRQRRGNLGDVLDAWVALRSLLDERPVHTAGSVTFRDVDGDDLDLTTSFTLDDDPDLLRHFLAEAGFLRLRGVFSEEEMAAVSDDIVVARDAYSPDDGNSWWVEVAGGSRRVARMQHFFAQSPVTAELLSVPRFASIGAIPGDGWVAPTDCEALEKPIGVVGGISDVPYHLDCAIGRHAYACCSLTAGVSVQGAGRGSGQLRVVAGSHRALIQPAFFRSEWGLPEVDLATETGDVTVHLSCTMHMAEPPVRRERQVLYTSFNLAPRNGEGTTRSVVSAARESAARTVSQKPGYVGDRSG